MTTIELIGVPFDGFGRAGHQAAAPVALREAGLAAALAAHDVVDAGDVALPSPDPHRGPTTSLVNEPALLAMAEAVGERVAAAVAAGRLPLVHGGDCTSLLGSIPALSADGPVGLLFLDGHEDTMPLDVSEDGEAANTEIGLLLGLTGGLLTGPLAERRGVLDRDHLAVLGPRDHAWRARFNVGTLRDTGVHHRTWREAASDPAGEGRAAAQLVRAAAGRWWLHVDLDVLDPTVFAAQGVPGDPGTPDGLTWQQLTELMVAAASVGGCVGWSMTIYDPEQDPDRTDAARIVALVAAVAAAL